MKDEVKNKASADGKADMPAPVEAHLVPAPLTPGQFEQLKDRAAKADEYWDRLLRQAAELENYKKRAARERHEAAAFANESLLARLLPVLDAFEMALAASAKEPVAPQSLQTGVAMISNQLKAALAEAGLEEINADSKPFDPNLHEAVAQEETTGVPEGHVARQIRKGYRFRNRLLRPAGVVVAKKPAA